MNHKQNQKAMIDGTYTRMLRAAIKCLLEWPYQQWTTLWIFSKGHCKDNANKDKAWRTLCKAGVNETCTVADTWWKNKQRITKEHFYRIDTLLEDTELATAGEIKTAIVDRINWRKRTHMPWVNNFIPRFKFVIIAVSNSSLLQTRVVHLWISFLQ